MPDISPINAFSYKTRIIDDLHNRHLEQVGVNSEDNNLFRATSVMLMDSSRATCHSIQTAFTGWSESLIHIIISWSTAKEIQWKPCVFHSYKSAFMKEFVIGDIPYQIRNLLVLHNVRYMIYQCLQLEKKNLLHYLHNRHLLMLPLRTTFFFRALSVMLMTSEGGHMLVCKHCISKWIRKLGSCYSMIDMPQKMGLLDYFHDRYSFCWCCLWWQLFLQGSICHIDELQGKLKHALTNWGRMTHICVSKPGHHWFR